MSHVHSSARSRFSARRYSGQSRPESRRGTPLIASRGDRLGSWLLVRRSTARLGTQMLILIDFEVNLVVCLESKKKKGPHEQQGAENRPRPRFSVRASE